MTSNTEISVPAEAWDTHIHVFEPDKHPYSPTRAYTPAAASLAQYPHHETGCTNIVVVQATVQGTDPTPVRDLLDRFDQSSPFGGTLRGLVVIDLDKTTDEELDQLHAAGVRGVRMHEVSWGFGQQASNNAVACKIQVAATRLNRLGWVLDMYMHPEGWAAAVPVIEALPQSTKLVADHWAGFRPGQESSAEFEAFLGLVRRRRIFVKLSAFERQYHGHPEGIASLEPMARALIEAGRDRILFASDWPNTALASYREGKTRQQRLEDVEDFRAVDHMAHIRCLREWIKDEDTWRKFWVDTPASLFA